MKKEKEAPLDPGVNLKVLSENLAAAMQAAISDLLYDKGNNANSIFHIKGS